MDTELFFNTITRTPGLTIPVEANFAIYIDNIKNIAKKVSDKYDIVSDQKLSVHNKGPAITEFDKNKENIFLATSVNLPGESVSTGRVGFTSDNTLYGGFLSAPVLKGRKDTNNLEITFIETEDSFIDYIIRPWIVTTAQFGLFARNSNSDQNFKTTIVIYFFSKQAPAGALRKTIIFNDAAPVDVGGYEAAYGKSLGVRTTRTIWTYSTYQIK